MNIVKEALALHLATYGWIVKKVNDEPDIQYAGIDDYDGSVRCPGFVFRGYYDVQHFARQLVRKKEIVEAVGVMAFREVASIDCTHTIAPSETNPSKLKPDAMSVKLSGVSLSDDLVLFDRVKGKAMTDIEAAWQSALTLLRGLSVSYATLHHVIKVYTTRQYTVTLMISADDPERVFLGDDPVRALEIIKMISNEREGRYISGVACARIVRRMTDREGGTRTYEGYGDSVLIDTDDPASTKGMFRKLFRKWREW